MAAQQQVGRSRICLSRARLVQLCGGGGFPVPEAPKNLTIARSQPSVWDRQSLSSTINTYDQERWMTAAWGSALTMIGARRGGFTGGLLAMLGGTIAMRAAMGRHDYTVARGWVDRTMR